MKDNFIIEAYPLSMLPNSHLSNPAYMKQYGLKTKTIKSYYSHVVDEKQDVVIATKDIDENTMKKMIKPLIESLVLKDTNYMEMVLVTSLRKTSPNEMPRIRPLGLTNAINFGSQVVANPQIQSMLYGNTNLG